MKTFVVITSIQPPTEAVYGFRNLRVGEVLVVGDKKSPQTYVAEGVRFISAEEQTADGSTFAKMLPWNHYSRKMLGYLEAIQGCADLIIDTDDDNIPEKTWSLPSLTGRFLCTPKAQGFINIYQAFSSHPIWPRGFPLHQIRNSYKNLEWKTNAKLGDCEIGIWQSLANGDPDVDAIYRLVDNTPIQFLNADPIVLAEGTACPINSQNTIFRREIFPLLYLPAFVSFRFTDILRGLIAQVLLWHTPYRLGFTGATVRQERNPHDYMKDFELEIPVYLQSEKVVEIAEKSSKGGRSLSENLLEVYRALHHAQIVDAKELTLLEAWLERLEKVMF